MTHEMLLADAKRGPPDHSCVVDTTGCALGEQLRSYAYRWRPDSRVAPDEVAPYPVRTTALTDGGSIVLVIVQVVGALLVLIPFAAQQFGKLNADASAYLWPNAIGSAALAVLAAMNGQWGFLLLEAVWAAVAARSIIRAARPVPR